MTFKAQSDPETWETFTWKDETQLTEEEEEVNRMAELFTQSEKSLEELGERLFGGEGYLDGNSI